VFIVGVPAVGIHAQRYATGGSLLAAIENRADCRRTFIG
jgi:hypothetical protein